MVETTSEPIWACCFLFWKIINYWLNFLINIDLFRLFIPSCMSFDSFCLSRNWSVSSRLSNMWAKNSSEYSSIVLIMSIKSVVICPLSLLILVIYVPPFFFLVSLARGLFILLIFSKNQLLVLLSLFIDFLLSISLISALIHITSFLLPTLDLISSSFSSFLRYKLGLLILDFYSFLIYALNSVNFPQSTIFTAFHKF